MVFHESLNQERKFSFVTPFVFIAILAGTTGVLEVATMLSPGASYALHPQAMLASLGDAPTAKLPPAATMPAGADTDKCEAGHQYEVTVDPKGKAETKDVGTKVDCKAKDAQGKLVNQSNAMCSKGKDGKGYGELKYKLSNGTSKDTLCYPGEDPKTIGLAAVTKDLGASPERADLLKALRENDPAELKRVNDTLGTLRDERLQRIAECSAGSDACVGPLNYTQGLKQDLSKTESAIEAIRKMETNGDVTPGAPDIKNPTEQELFDAERAAKLKAEKAELEAPARTGPVSCSQAGANAATCIPGGEAAAEPKQPPARTGPVSCGQPGADAATCIPTGGTKELKQFIAKQEAATKGPDVPDTKSPSGGSNPLGAIGSFLEGLAKALGAPKPPPATPPQACQTDPNAYAQQQQQYQYALQQYNYQLQLYNQQQQQASIYGTPAPVPPAQPTPCTPSTGNQCQAQPQQPAASACAAGSWRATYTGACVTGWQCISTEGPKAELSCEPKVADVGMTLAITYGCSSGVASSSSFKVTTQPGGSATTTVADPPAGTNTATYTLACTDNGKTTGAQCAIQVARANIILVANPKTVPANGTSLLSWLTTGMQSCIISSPDQADFTARNSSNTSVTGAATTSAITTASSTAIFQLDCKTLAGTDRQATTSVSLAP